jgi:hypothetical protein
MDFTDNPLATVKVKNSLATFVQQNGLTEKLIKHIQTIPNYHNLKNDIELIKYVCKMIEQLVKAGNSDLPVGQKLDKKQLALTILQQLFALSQPELLFVGNLIDFLIANQMVKKKTCLSKLQDVVYSRLPTLPK